MKKILSFWMCTMLMLAFSMSSCSSDDDEIGSVVRDDNSVRGGVIYDGWGKPEVDTSDPLAVFFRDELHGPYWDGYGNEFKTFFEQGKWDDESCLMINSRQEFQHAYMGTKELPDVDFSNYTLIIGRTWGNDSSYKLDDIILRDKSAYYELETKLLHDVEGYAFAAIVGIYYWRLYPKLEKKNIITKRTVEEADHPTTLDGTWHLVKGNYSFGGMKEHQAGEVTITFNDNSKTITVENNIGTTFLKSGTYPYSTTIEQSRIYTYQWVDVEYKVMIIHYSDEAFGDREVKYCYSLDGEFLFLDGGVAYDGPGYYFKKAL